MLGWPKPGRSIAGSLLVFAALFVMLMQGPAAAQSCVTTTDCTTNGGVAVPLVPGPPGAQICQATAPAVAGFLICTGGGAQASTTTISSAPNPSSVGQSVTLTATVIGANPTGSVTFVEGLSTLGTVALTGGTASLNTSALSGGTHSITASYTGDTNNLPSTSTAVTQTVNKANSTTTVSSSLNPSKFGQTVTFTATVSGSSPAGTVTFFDGATQLGTRSLSGGTATFATSALTVGSHSITVSYAGNTNNNGSTSSAISHTVNKANSTTTVSSSLNPSKFGQTVTFTATVSGSSPTGNVTFRNGATTLGTVALSGGVATFSTSALTAGSHSITAAYAGNTNNNASTSAALSQTVNPAKVTTTTTLSSSLNPSPPGAAVTFTATVAGNAPAGSVTFRDGSTVLGIGALSGGVATFTTSALSSGAHTITAAYAGDSNNQASTSSALTQTVNKAESTVALSSSLNPSPPGAAATFTATVTGNAPSGSVTFRDGSKAIGTAALSGGVATFTTSALTPGTHSITASYAGDSNNLSSKSSSVFQSVDRATSTVTLSSSADPSKQGAPVTFTASVSGFSPAGTVTFRNGATQLGTAALSDGAATFTTSALAPGTHSITASYEGDANNNTSESPILTQTVTAVIAVTTTTVSSTPNPSQVGQSVTFTATVTGNNPTGTVEFFNGSTSLGASNLNDGTATLTTSELPVGPLTITASYSGDTQNQASTSSGSHEVTTATPAPLKLTITFSVTVELSTSEIAELIAQLESQYAETLGISKAQIEIVVTQSAGPSGSRDARVVSPAHAAPANKVLCANVPVVNGIARCSAEIPLTTRHQIKVTFTGTKNGVPTKIERTLSVKSPSGVLLSIPPGPVAVGQPFTMTAAVVPPTAQGKVSFANSAGGVVPGCGAVPVASGKATCTTNTATAAAPSFVATYSGGDVNEGSASAPAALQLTGQTAKTVATIARFLSARNNQILTNEPDSDRQVDRLIEANGSHSAASGLGPNTHGAAGFVSRLGDGPDASDLSRMRLAPRAGGRMSEPLNVGTALNSAGISGDDAQEGPIGSGGPLKVTGSTDGADRFSFATSLRDMLRYSADSEGRKAASNQAIASGLGYATSSTSSRGYQPLPFDVWIEGNYTSFRDDEHASDTDGHIALISVGADYVINRSLLIGTVIQFDSMRQRSRGDMTEASGEGWMAGPYATVRLTENVFWQSRALWGRSSNEVSPFLTYVDHFDTERWLASSKLAGRWDYGAWSFRPSASIAYIEDTSEAYVDAFGALTPSVSSQLGQAKIGPELSYKVEMADGTSVTPFGGAQLIWNFAGDTDASGAGAAGLGTTALQEAGPNGVRGRVELGIRATTLSGLSLDFSGSYDGIGTSDYDAVTGQATLRVPLN